jgi:hypothetical protein
MVCFPTKNPNLGKFLRVLQWKMLAYLLDIWSILRPFGIFYRHLINFVVLWYFGKIWQSWLTVFHVVEYSVTYTALLKGSSSHLDRDFRVAEMHCI